MGSGLAGGGYGVLNASFPKRIAEGPRGCVGSPSIRLGFQMFPGNGLSTCIILLLLLTAWRREIQSTQRSALAHAQHNTDGHNKPWGRKPVFVVEFWGKIPLFFNIIIVTSGRRERRCAVSCSRPRAITCCKARCFQRERYCARNRKRDYVIGWNPSKMPARLYAEICFQLARTPPLLLHTLGDR